MQQSEAEASAGGAGDVRQPVPGVLLMDYHTRAPSTNDPAHGICTYHKYISLLTF